MSRQKPACEVASLALSKPMVQGVWHPSCQQVAFPPNVTISPRVFVFRSPRRGAPPVCVILGSDDGVSEPVFATTCRRAISGPETRIKGQDVPDGPPAPGTCSRRR
jgi:hypothetical protein